MEECAETLRDGLQHERIRNIRGFSTFMAFDVDERDDLVSKLEDLQVVVGSCGESSIRLRPPLNLSVIRVTNRIEKFILCGNNINVNRRIGNANQAVP